MSEELIERLISALEKAELSMKAMEKRTEEAGKATELLYKQSFSHLRELQAQIEKVGHIANKAANTNIPAEVKATLEHKHTIETSGKAFLVACGLFFLIGMGMMGYNWWRMSEVDRIYDQAKTKELDQKQIDWLIDFHDYQKQKNPNDTKTFHAQKPYPK